MGFWGERFFENDRDFDLVGIFALHLGVDDLYMPQHPQQLREDLDSGKLEAEFHYLRNGAYAADEELTFLGIKTAIAVLAVAAMRHGAAISDDFRQYVRNALKSRLQMYQRAKDELGTAIDTYRNGVPLDLAGTNLFELMDKMETPRAIGLNRLSPQVFICCEDVEDECHTCGKSKDTLMRCGRCHRARYCDADCQKKAWKKHKHACRPVA